MYVLATVFISWNLHSQYAGLIEEGREVQLVAATAEVKQNKVKAEESESVDSQEEKKAEEELKKQEQQEQQERQEK